MIDSTTRGEGLFPNPIAKSCKKSTITHITNKFKVLYLQFSFVLIVDFSSSDNCSDELSKIAVYWIYLYHRFCVAISCLKKKRSSSGIFTNSTPSWLVLFSSCKHSLVSNIFCIHFSKYIAANGEVDSIDELYLDFVLPGFNKFELMKSGASKAVNGENLSKYIDLVTHWTMLEVFEVLGGQVLFRI